MNKAILRAIQVLTLTTALPLASGAATFSDFPFANKQAKPASHPVKKIPVNGVYIDSLRVKPGQLSFKVTGKFVKSYKETWTSAEDTTLKATLLSAFYQHKSIDITDYTLPADGKSNTLVAKEVTVHP